MSAQSTRCERALRVSIVLYVACLISGMVLSFLERPGILALVPCLILLVAIAMMIHAISLREAELESEEENNDA